MEDINTIYYNNFGIAFQWKRCAAKNWGKTQLVFRKTGIHLTQEELIQFSKNINGSLHNKSQCKNCEDNQFCQSVLLEIPDSKVSLAMNYDELISIKDLVKGTLFNLNFDVEIEQILNV